MNQHFVNLGTDVLYQPGWQTTTHHNELHFFSGMVVYDLCYDYCWQKAII